MSSRYLAAAAAWVLGAAIATTGSIIAVNELAHGLLSQPAQQLVGTKASENHEGHATAAPSDSASASVTPAPTSGVVPSPAPTPAVSEAPPAQAGTFLSSSDGSVVAVCQSGGAYLQYWSPAQGFEADDVARGPAAVASVSFTGPGGGILMRVTCTAGTPAARMTALAPEPADSSEAPGE